MNMTSQPKQIIMDILHIIGYADDKDAYADKFLQLCIQHASKEMIDKKTTRNYNFFLKKATKDLFIEFIDSVYSSLYENQKKKLDSFLLDLSIVK